MVWYEKLVLKSGARKWCRFMVPVSGECVTGSYTSWVLMVSCTYSLLTFGLLVVYWLRHWICKQQVAILTSGCVLPG